MNLQPRKICLLVVLCRAFYRKFVLPFVSSIEKKILRADRLYDKGLNITGLPGEERQTIS